MSSDILTSRDAIGRRLSEAIQALGVTHRVLGETIGVSQSFFSQVRSGTAYPSVTMLTGLRLHYKVSLDWLLLGDGPMFHAQATTSDEPIVVRRVREVVAAHPALEARLLGYIDGLSAAHPQATRKTA